MTDYSDHTKKQIKIEDYLPEVFRSDINKSISEMAFDRHFTKDDTIRVTGYVGTGNPSAIVSRQIQEVSSDSHDQAHRQAFQLTPTMYTKQGTIETALSYKNFLTQLELQGVDRDRLPLWASSLEFNWVPPINIDMLVNYQDYFWSSTGVSDLPQYLTIENRCNKASDKVTSYELLMQQRGMHFPIVNIDFDNNIFVLSGRWDNIFSTGFAFQTSVSNTINLENKYWNTVTVQYSGGDDKTKVQVAEPIAPTTPPIAPEVGEWWYDTTTQTLYVWDSVVFVPYTDTIAAQIILPALFEVLNVSFANNTFSIEGKQDDLFVNGFVFLTKDSSNINLQNKFWTTATATYDEASYRTIVQSVEPIAQHSETPPTANFVGEWWYKSSTNTLYAWTGTTWMVTSQSVIVNISLAEVLLVFQTELNCKCYREYGWDIKLWDDNSAGNVAWNPNLQPGGSLAHPTEAAWLAQNTLVDFAIWHDTTTNQLKQYGDIVHPLPSDPLYSPTWNVIFSNFSAILTLTTYQENWDETVGCDAQVLNQWSAQNRWQHKTAVTSFGSVKRAQVPILEYDSRLELNEWTQINYTWKYRASADTGFSITTTTPSRLELEPIKGFIVENSGGSWYIYLFDKTTTMNANVDLTNTFVSGYQFRIIDDAGFNQTYTVDRSEFQKPISANPALSGDYMVTAIKLKESVFSAPLSGGGLGNIRIVPRMTSNGDSWRGYHIHWMLDTTVITTSPVKPQQWNQFRTEDAADIMAGTVTQDPVAGNPAYTGFTPQVGIISYGVTYQEIVIDLNNVTQIDLISSLKYNPSVSSPYATPNSNELRVYINNVRQYGTYTELTSTSLPNYTAIGLNLVTDIPIEYVTGIVFPSAVLNVGDVVRIEVSPASMRDMGLYSVPVRTVEDDTLFSQQVTSLQQPEYRSLTRFELNEQNKIGLNQYPLFNVYDIITGEIVLASPIITFREDPTAPINGSVQKRILVNGVDYEFEQHLLDRDDNLLYGYRNLVLPVVGRYWYSPANQSVMYWDGHAWADRILLGNALRTPVISDTEPSELLGISNALWLNSTTNKLYQRVGANWTEITNLVVNDADPTLRTIWRHGVNDETYVPQYVDKDRNVVGVGTADGDWEVVEQWRFNPEHRNKQFIKFSQLVTHFRSIIAEQTPIVGFIGGGVYTRTQDEYNYGVGGTIKEYNGAFDTLISSVNVTNVTPVGVIEYASAEYAANIRFVRDIFNHSIIDLFNQYTVDTLLDFTQYVVDNVIALYEDNDYAAKIYGDTSAYIEATNIGVRNWIATAPIFGLSPAYRPHLLEDGEFTQVFHHDGHRTNVIFTTAEEDALAREIIALTDPRVTGETLGGVGATLPPATESDFLITYGGFDLRSGVFWYKTGTPRAFYRFEMYASSAIHPSFYYNGVEVPDGVLYYNTITHLVYEKIGLTWIAASSTPYDISLMWKIIDFQHLLGELYLEIENRLYAVCVHTPAVFDYSTLTPTPSEQTVYDTNYRKRFDNYVVNFSVPTPYVNTQYRQTDAFTWNYLTSNVLSPPHNDTTTAASSWQQLYTNWYGTPYPHLEPWKLQGYHDKPTWWDAYYLETNGTRRWIYNHNTTTGMWENIRIGVIPSPVVGKPIPTYPNGINSVTGNPFTDGQPAIRTYNYFSVNISNNTIAGGYASDQLLPPYYLTSDIIVRSIFTALSQIIAPDADYVFGDGSLVEWQWKVSSSYPYENPVIAFLMQPVTFLRASFGPTYTIVDKLEVDVKFKQVYSHTDALFHGDMYNTNLMYEAKGLNQWYVNYNRFTGYDTSDTFRQLWVGWTPLLTYQFNGIVDTSTLDIANKNFDVINQDYNVVLVNNGVVQDLWADAFNIGVLSIPPAIIQYNNQNKWKLEIDSLASIAREISYYDVKAYPFTVDATTDTCYAYRYTIVGVDSASKRFFVTGNETDVFVPGTQLTVSESTYNNGNFSVLSSVYEPGTDRTRINVVQSVLGVVADGVLNVSTFAFPWSTGDMVVLSTSKLLPSPLVPNTPYYVINIGNQSFKLAETYNEALTNVAIDITSPGMGVHTIAEIVGSFVVLGGDGHSKDTWYHYALDKDTIRTITPPYTFNGMQTLINIIDGYAEYQHETGLIFNSADSNDFDPVSARQINWSLEVERFIDWAYGLRRARLEVNDRYEYTANITDNTLTFTDTIPYWNNGTAVQVSTTGSLPSPLDAADTYYVYQTGTPGVIKLSASQDVNYTPFHIDLLTSGSGHLYIAIKDKLRTYPQFEINPNRNNIWLDTPEGVLADVVQGPYTDIRVRQTIFDQYGRIITPDKLIVYRQDKRSRIAVMPQLPNDVDLFYVDDPYNYIHIGGGHFFLDGYEHFVLFNPYTTGNILMYDSFLGLSTSKFEVDFFKKEDRTLRPTLGGYYLKGQQFLRNIEGSATDLQNFYDAYAGSEDSPSIKLARSLVGYPGRTDYMEMLNVNSKSQFLFYRGMLHAKGSVSSVMAYINSRRFVDAKIDEYWAVKIADFGDKRPRVYPEILLFADDGIVDDIRLEFVGLDDDPNSTEIQTAVNDKGFKLVTFADDARWNNFPEQKAEILDPLFLDAELAWVERVFVSPAPPIRTRISDIDYWYNSNTNEVRTWNGFDWSTVVYNKSRATVDHIFWQLNSPCDDVRVVRRDATNYRATISSIVQFTATSPITPETSVPLAPGTYGFDLDIDGTGQTSFSIVVTGTETMRDLSALMTNVLMAIATKAEVIVQGGNLIITSQVALPPSTVEVIEPSTGGNPDLFAAIDAALTATHTVILQGNNDVLHSYRFDSTVTTANAFTVSGDITNMVYSNAIITTLNTAGNDGVFTVQNSWYDDYNDITYIFVTTQLMNTGAGGKLSYIFTDFDYYNSIRFNAADTGLEHYSRINSEVIRMDVGAFFDILHIYAIRPSNRSMNPAKLVDKQSNTLVNQITLWHPAFDHHYYKAIHNIDLYNDQDPARYQITLNPADVSEHFWDFTESGTTWFDTSRLGYIPYYDEKIYPDINDRLYKWGNLAEYADVKVYQWVRSPVPPSQWDITALQQQGLLTIPANEKITGTVRKTLFKRTRQTYTGKITFGSSTIIELEPNVFVNNDQTIFVTSTSTLPEGLSNQEQYVVGAATQTSPQTFQLTDPVSGDVVNIDGATNSVKVVNIGTATSPINVFQVKSGTLVEGDYVTFTSNMTGAGGTIPSPLVVGTNYVVSNLLSVEGGTYQTFRVKPTNSGTLITLTDNGIGPLVVTNTMKNINIVPIFENNWVKQEFAHRRIIGAMLDQIGNPDLVYWTPNIGDPVWNNGDEISIYLNGIFVFTTILSVNTTTTPDRFEVNISGAGITIQPQDYIDVVRPLHTLTHDEAAFDPDVDDDGTTLVHWKEDYEYSQSVVAIGTNGSQIINYYFWVEGSTTQSSDTDSMSILEIRNSLMLTPDPYFIVQKPLDSYAQILGYGYDQTNYGLYWGLGSLPEFLRTIPVMYREAIVRNVATYINDNNRYMIQFTRDMALRDNLKLLSSSQQLKEKYEEWLMFRREQLNNIPQFLWDKLTESLSGQSLTNSSPVPALERVLYDDEHDAETRFGINDGQTFVDRALGMNTLMNYLQDPARDFTPVDIDDFFVRNDFTTPTGIITAMNEIYTAFGAEHVNGIWFEMLQDALSSRTKYKGLMKTSWVALHGIRVLEVGGLFDE